MNRQAKAAVALAAVLGVGLWNLPSLSMAAGTASIQPVLDPDGSGRMVVNSQTNPSTETWSWESCSPDLETCAPFAKGRMVGTAGAPAPTVFRAVSSFGATAVSPRWNGNVSPASPPTVAGTVRANELVVPLPGHWIGGWDGDVNWTQLAACRSPSDEGCTTLTHRHYVGGCRNGAAVIDPIFAGRYLRVAARRVPAHTPELAYAVGSPYTPEIWPAGPTVAVAFIGRIQRETGPPASGCGPSPLVEASISRRGVATVRCGLSCRATLVAQQGRRRASVSRKLAALPEGTRSEAGLPQLRLSPGKLKRFEPGRARFVVKVYGRAFASRNLHFPEPRLAPRA